MKEVPGISTFGTGALCLSSCFVVVAKPDGIRAAPSKCDDCRTEASRRRIGELVEYRLGHALLKGGWAMHDYLRGRVGKRSTVKKTA
jgi:hypothetical protein